jgi:methyltransferase (TIGR00027 family)
MSALPTSNVSIVRRGEPSRTAHRVAMLRAVHQLLDEPPVLPDPVALPLLGAAAEAALRADPFVLNDPLTRSLRAFVVARSRFVEDELARGIAAGVRQYVLLGAGLDTGACRSGAFHPALRVFEVDHPGTQAWKRALLAEAGLGVPSSLAFVPADLECDDPLAALRRAGFDAGQPACVGWLGVTMYLSPDAVLRTLGTLAGLADGSSVCFDHRVSPGLLNPVERAVDEAIERQAAAAGEPWRSAFDPAQLQRELLARGFGGAESVAPAELNARYFARRKDGLCVGANPRLMCARVGDPGRG